MKTSNAQVDFELESIKIAKELTIAKLQSSSPNATNTEVGTRIGEMFLAIHEEVQKSFNQDQQK